MIDLEIWLLAFTESFGSNRGVLATAAYLAFSQHSSIPGKRGNHTHHSCYRIYYFATKQMHPHSNLTKRQNIARYIRLIWLDLLFITFACVLAYVISLGKPFRMYTRVFPMWFNDSTGLWEGELKYSYPHIPYVLGIFKSGLLIGTVPIGAVILMQIWVRNLLDLNAAIWGLLKALTLMSVHGCPTDHSIMRCIDGGMNIFTKTLRILFQFILKQYIGGFRPYFLTLCNPNIGNLNRYLEHIRSHSATTSNPSRYTAAERTTAYNRVFATPADCQATGDKSALIHAMQSFPSGHSGMAFAVGVFLSLYLNAKLKSFADYHTRFWKILLVLLPLIGATTVAGGLMVDKVI